MIWRALTCRVLVWCAALGGCAAATTQQERDREAIRREASADQLFHKGQASAALGDMIRAEQYYVSALKAGGDERKIVEKLLVVCSADNRYPAALDYAEQYLYRHPGDVDVEFAAGSIHAVAGDPVRAQELLEDVVKKRPDWADAHFTLATVLRGRGMTTAADVHDVEYLRLKPGGDMAERARARLSRSEP